MDHDFIDILKFIEHTRAVMVKKEVKCLKRTSRKSLESMKGIKMLIIDTKMFAAMDMMYLWRNQPHVEGQLSFS